MLAVASPGSPRKQMAIDKQLVEDMTRHLCECLRNGHLCLARGDTGHARTSVDEARSVHRRLATIARADGDHEIGPIIVRVLGDRVEGLAALTRQNRAS